MLLFTASANAEEFTAKYEASWNNIAVGELIVQVNETSSTYQYDALVNSLGLLRTFSKYWSKNTAKGKIIDGEVIPASYFTYWERKKEKQQIDVAYTNNGKTVRETANPPEKRWKRPEVEPQYKDNTLDPVATALVLRKKVKEIIESGQTLPAKVHMPVFDARRSFDVELNISGYKKVRYQGKQQNMLEVTFFRTPVAGWNEKELARYKQQDPKITFYLNEKFLPTFGTGAAPFGKANFELVSYCEPLQITCK